MIRRRVLILCLCTLIHLIGATALVLGAENDLVSVSVNTDKVFYSRSEILNIESSLNNFADTPLQDIRAVVSIASLDVRAEDLRGEKHFSQTLFAQPTVAPGQLEMMMPPVSLARWLPGVGSYILTVDITSENESITTSQTAVMIESQSRTDNPLRVMLVWDIHQKATFGPDGVYGSDRGGAFFGSTIENLLVPAAEVRMPVGYGVSPLSLIQAAEGGSSTTAYPDIQDISAPDRSLEISSDVYLSELQEGDKGTTLLRALRGLLSTDDAEYIQSPLAHASLGDMAEYGWHSDVFQQIDRGREVSAGIFGDDVSEAAMGRGYLLPEGELSASVIADLAAKDIGFAIASDNSYSGDERIQARPYLARDTESNELPVVFTDSRIDSLLENADDTADARIVMGALLQQYLESSDDDGNPDPVIALSPEFRSGAVKAQAVAYLYQLMVEEGWILPISPSELLADIDDSTPTYIVRARGVEGNLSSQDEFTTEMISARTLLKSFLDSAEDSETAADRMWPLIYLAQDTSWRGSDLDDLGMSYVGAVTELVDNEFERVSMNVRPVTLTSETGKIPVEIRNDSDYSLTLQLVASGSGILFPEGASRTIDLPPGAEIQSIAVEVQSFTREPVTLTLLAGEHVIGVKELAVSGNSIYVVLTVVALAVILLGAAFVLVVKYRRGGVGQRVSRGED